jgi:Family of unknown function (DUF5681)
MPFEPGQSGNPAGKAKGTRNKVTLAIEALLDGEAEALTRSGLNSRFRRARWRLPHDFAISPA